MSSSLLLFPQRFGRYVLRPSDVCRTREPSRNFELRPLWNPRCSPTYMLRSSVKVPEFDKHLKKAGGHIGRNVGGNNNKDEDNSPKNLNDKNQQASSQKFRQLILYLLLTEFIKTFDLCLFFPCNYTLIQKLDITEKNIKDELKSNNWVSLKQTNINVTKK